MVHRTAQLPTEAELDRVPTDITTMRTSARRALTEAHDTNDLTTLAHTLRSHMQVLIPEVEAAAGQQPEDSIPRYCALACVGEARRKLRIGNGQTLPARVAVAQKLARCVNALCDHYENLGGLR
ncbi:DUF6415 family natural product biosynthesis protein [Streptomyces sp. NPDC007808]|uniref:DUF6415 family natural product biosynthesis protein n=1 Tax=Streptomyces sp. NPDC007808 TaxID=3364779 RepID=UPI0036930908